MITPYYSPDEETFNRAWEYDLENQVIAISWFELGDPTNFSSVNELKRKLQDAYPTNKRQFDRIAKAIWDFYHTVKPGDIFIVRKGIKKLIGYGRVKSRVKAYYDKEKGKERISNEKGYCPNFREVEWTPIEIDLDKQLLQFTFYEISKEEYEDITNKIIIRNENKTWVNEIIKAFAALGGVAESKMLYEYIEKNTSRELAANWKPNINKIIRIHSSDSKDSQYTGKDYFRNIGELGDGYWGLRIFEKQRLHPAPDSEDYAKVWKKEEILRVVRDSKISRDLKSLYENKCQICGKSIHLKNYDYSEVHHIKPLGKKHDGPDTMDNMIVLCPNHHVEFDYGAIAIDPQTLTIIHKEKNSHINGKKITLLENYQLNPEFLQYHIKEIYKFDL